MKKRLLFLALPVLCLTAACNREFLPVTNPETGRGPILFTANPLFQSTVDTKTQAVTALQSFYVGCVTGTLGSSEVETWKTTFTSDNQATPTYSGDKYWPIDDPEYKFYASNAAMTASASGYTVSASNTTDVVCAVLSDPDYASKNALTFEHIFARLGNVTVTADPNYTISAISIRITPKTGGTYSLYSGNGQSDGTGWLTTETGAEVAIYSLTAPGTQTNDLYLVPGTYTLTATWTATRGNYTETFTNRQNDVELVGGKSNAITTTLTGNATGLAYGVSLTAWNSGSAAVTFPLADPTAYAGASFNGLMIAPAPLYYNGTTFVIKDDDWNHDSFNSLYGKVEGSYYFDLVDLGSYFDSRGNSYTDTSGELDNNGSKVSYGGFDDWRVPTLNDLWSITSGTSRSGSTINGASGRRYALIQLTGVTHAGNSTPVGLLLAPDGETITGMSRTFTWNTESTSGNTGVTEAQLNEYLDEGCIFIPASGAYADATGTGSGWKDNGEKGMLWTTHQSNEASNKANYLYFSNEKVTTAWSGERQVWNLPARLVRDIE